MRLLVIILVCISTIAAQGKETLKLIEHSGLEGALVNIYLPEDYKVDKDRKFPVIYMIDNNPFYKGEFTESAIRTIRELELLNDFPSTIIIDIKLKKLYSAVTHNRETLNEWLNTLVFPTVASQFRVHERSVFIGYSYSAAWTAADLSLNSFAVTDVLNISPVFENYGYLENTGVQPSKSKHAPNIITIYGNEELRMLEQLESVWSRFERTSRAVIVLEQENHQSVFLPGLRIGLLKIFSSFQMPTYKGLVENLWTIEMVDSFFEDREKNYGVKVTEDELSSLSTKVAIIVTEQGYIDVAEKHWHRSQTPHKAYFLKQIYNKLIIDGKPEQANKVKSLSERLVNNSK